MHYCYINIINNYNFVHEYLFKTLKSFNEVFVINGYYNSSIS
jgi:hypothetical protein